ncbi:MAG: DUF4340 domain-containing protein [Sedimenticola sp.]|nr:DUF4340 domain-containing protein [Sedimenticola sp.]
MKRQTLINLFLLLSVLVLGFFAWFSPVEQEQPKQAPLTGLNSVAIKRIKIHNNNGPEFEMQRVAGKWQMVKPYPVPANGPRIDILMDLLSTPQVDSFPVPIERLAEFGLEKPLAVVTFNDTQITFGGTHPYNYRRYVRIENQLYLINDIFPHHVLARAEDFISHALFPENSQISEIETPEWHIFETDGNWQMTPASQETSAEALQNKLNSWLHTWVSKVSKAPGEAPSGEIVVQLKGVTEPTRFAIIRNKTGTLLVREELGLAYHLTSDNLLQAPVTPD